MKTTIKEPSLWLLIFLVGFPQISETIYTPSLPELAHLLNVGNSDVQSSLSIYFIGFAVGVLLWGILSDKIGRRPAMLAGVALYILGSIGCLFASTLSYLLMARFVQACGAAAGSIVTQTVMRDCYNDERRPHIFAQISAVLAFSPAIGPLMGSFIGQYAGVRYVFLSLVLLGILAWVFTLRGLNETKPTIQSHQQPSFRQVAYRMLRDKDLLIYASLIGIINGIIFSYYGEAPFIFINQLDFSTVGYGSLGFIIALASFTGALVGKHLLRKYHFRKVMFQGFGVMLAGSILFILTALGIEQWMCVTVLYLVGIFCIMAGIGIALPSCLSNALLNYKDCLGVAGAILGLLYYLCVSILTEGMSLLHTGSAVVLPTYVAILTVLMCLLTHFLRPAKK